MASAVRTATNRLVPQLATSFVTQTAAQQSSALKAAFTETKYESVEQLPPTRGLSLGGFFKKGSQIAQVNGHNEAAHGVSLGPVYEKPAHNTSLASTVTFETEGDVPPVFENASHGFVRLGPGSGNKAPGISLGILNDNQLPSGRLFLTSKGSDYNTPTLGQDLFGLSVRGPEGNLEWHPSLELSQLSLANKEGVDWRAIMYDNNHLTSGVYQQACPLGYITPKGYTADNAPWRVRVTTDAALTANDLADTGLHWHRKISLANSGMARFGMAIPFGLAKMGGGVASLARCGWRHLT